MSKFISRLFGTSTSTTLDLEPEIISSETVLKEAKVNALADFLNDTGSEILAEALANEEVSFPTLVYVHVADDAAYVTEIEFSKKLGSDGLPIINIKSASRDVGQLYDGDVFVSDTAVLDFTDEELETKIQNGEIGQGTCFLSGSVISAKAIFGQNCIVSEDAKVFGGVFGDNVVIGRKVWVGDKVELASGVLVGKGTSLNGNIRIGFSPDNEAGVEPALVMIGDSCALDDCSIKRGTIMGKHCLVENNPSFNGTIPNGATVIAQGETFAVVPF